MSDTNGITFSPELVAFIKEWKTKPGNLIMVLHKVQEEVGYISREAADAVASMLDVPLATIWGVVSFYHFFKLTKPGKHNI
jgi:NADH-quinone oxidoreductase subunit E